MSCASGGIRCLVSRLPESLFDVYLSSSEVTVSMLTCVRERACHAGASASIFWDLSASVCPRVRMVNIVRDLSAHVLILRRGFQGVYRDCGGPV